MTGRDARLALLVGPLFLLLGVFLAYPHVAARIEFTGAPQVRATVVDADYRLVKGSSEAERVTLAVPGPVPLADLGSAPGGLSPGEAVTVLSRPGHVLFPSQLRWSVFLLPGGLCLAGLFATVVGFRTVRAEPVSRPADPEAW